MYDTFQVINDFYSHWMFENEMYTLLSLKWFTRRKTVERPFQFVVNLL